MGGRNMSGNRREFFRVEFDQFINGEVTIVGGGTFTVKIDNISIGGMGFISDIEIPMHDNIKCAFRILDRSFRIDGVIIRKSRKLNYIDYGAAFEMDQLTASQLFNQLNYYQIRQRRGNPD